MLQNASAFARVRLQEMNGRKPTYSGWPADATINGMSLPLSLAGVDSRSRCLFFSLSSLSLSLSLALFASLSPFLGLSSQRGTVGCDGGGAEIIRGTRVRDTALAFFLIGGEVTRVQQVPL